MPTRSGQHVDNQKREQKRRQSTFRKGVRKMKRNRTASQHDFAVIPKTDVPRSRFLMKQTRKQAFNASELVPVMCEEVLPGDTWQHTETIMARLATPIAPAVDDIDLETWYFFVPNRITWQGTAPITNWEQFITGNDTALSVPKVIPFVTGPGYVVQPNGIFDHFGILPQSYSADVLQINVLPIWAYFQIYNEWFRDENLQEIWEWSPNWTTQASNTITQNGAAWDQTPLRVNKRSDYFTRSLPWPQKGTAVSIPLGTTAPVFTTGVTGDSVRPWVGANPPTDSKEINTAGALGVLTANTGVTGNLYADLANATAATINSLRLAMATQQLLEKDARGGTRYVESLLVHFGVRSPDYRLQRPEYLGGSKIPITVNPIAQTADYTETAATALGNLGAEMHASGHNRTFTYAATEHGYIIGLCAVRATPTYQQGTRRHWNRDTRLDFFWPTLANLGEQAVATQEIFQNTTNVPTVATWGYQERNAEYRYTPNEITGVLRSTATAPLDWWHYAEEFSAEPALNASFITDKTKETLARSLAVQTDDNWSAQIIMDILHVSQVARLMPAYSVPGLTRF
ncbi:MAG: major capsid protein [Arizlama microvirus]|nr:MAG: major capsid protein [Arizlama microvirus]